MAKGYGNLPKKFQKFFKNKPPSFDVGDRVIVVKEGYYFGQTGRITVRANGKWGVTFPWDIEQSPVYYDSNDLERKND